MKGAGFASAALEVAMTSAYVILLLVCFQGITEGYSAIAKFLVVFLLSLIFFSIYFGFRWFMLNVLWIRGAVNA
jgi:hypothetical protein